EVQKAVQEIADGQTNIGIAMIDLNYLKKINDTYGHDKGNVAIITLCQIVCHIFDHSPVFRIGGDEFVVVLRGHDLEHIDELIEEFNRQLKEKQDNAELQYWEKVSAAIGYAVYDSAVDSDFDALFKRADDAMYKNKEAMKATRE
ncbi:MAG: GGDEF domain-containing protein, partial [Treponema sp.]|nr:GGDEF domain-containing protein [Treponema sp.]